MYNSLQTIYTSVLACYKARASSVTHTAPYVMIQTESIIFIDKTSMKLPQKHSQTSPNGCRQALPPQISFEFKPQPSPCSAPSGLAISSQGHDPSKTCLQLASNYDQVCALRIAMAGVKEELLMLRSTLRDTVADQGRGETETNGPWLDTSDALMPLSLDVAKGSIRSALETTEVPRLRRGAIRQVRVEHHEMEKEPLAVLFQSKTGRLESCRVFEFDAEDNRHDGPTLDCLHS